MSRNNASFSNGNYKYSISPVNIETCLNFLARDLTVTKKKYRYLELGCGAGLSLNIHAAANGGEFWGVELNPSLAAVAVDVAHTSDTGAIICNQTFEAFSQRKDLPDFDIIVVQDSWSWLSVNDQKNIIDFVKHKLALGGAFYVNYNTPSGKWAKLSSVRELIKLHIDRASIQSDEAVTKIKNAAIFVDQVIGKNPNSKQSSLLADEIEKLKNIDSVDMAKDYLVDHWHLFSFSDMTAILSDAKLSFACHGELLKNLDTLSLETDSITFLNEMTDPILQEMTRDFLIDYHSRSDIWVKGARVLNRVERTQMLTSLKFILPKRMDAMDLDVNFPVGNTNLQNDVYGPVLECLAESDYMPKSADDLVNYYQLRHLNRIKILDALIVLLSINYIYPAQQEETIKAVKIKTNDLNTYLLEQSVHSDVVHYLASPVTGSGIEVSRIHQLFLLARLEDVSSPDEWASLAWQLISQQEQVTKIENTNINSPEEGLNLLKEMAHQFTEKQLPILKALGIAD